jgi:1-acyl-sn-glycerol-3-phosphate acyltransferase
MAPEGTRSPLGYLLPFKTGAFRIALKTKTPIVVLALEKPWEILPKGNLLPLYSGTVNATFLGKIDPLKFLESPENTEKHLQSMIYEARVMFLKHGLTES